MSFSRMLSSCSAVDVLIAIRSSLAEQYRPAPRAPQHDPWWGADFDFASAWAYAPVVIAE